MTDTQTKSAVRAWLLDYAWSGTAAEQARNVDCILSQDGWHHLDVRADAYAGAQFEPGPEAFAEGEQFALSALYECHGGPHIESCPMKGGIDDTDD